MIDDPDGETDTTATEEATPAAPAIEATATEDGDDWSEARTEPETGIALDAHGLPVNHRLRAERLATDGKTSDPAGTVSDELIAGTKERLDAEREAFPPIRANMKTADLERIAENEGIDLSSATNNAERVAIIETARGEAV